MPRDRMDRANRRPQWTAVFNPPWHISIACLQRRANTRCHVVLLEAHLLGATVREMRSKVATATNSYGVYCSGGRFPLSIGFQPW